MAGNSTDIFVARRGAVLWWKGTRYSIVRGRTTVRAGHPILAGREDLFEPLTVTFDHLADGSETPVGQSATRTAGQDATGQKPDGQKPDGQKPDGQKPDGQEADSSQPQDGQPDGQKPGPKPPATQSASGRTRSQAGGAKP